MAVYTVVDRPELDSFLDTYDIGGAIRLEGILQGVENSNYLLETTHGRYVLTVFEQRAAAADLPYFLGLMAHLAAEGYPAPAPIVRRDDGLIGEISGKPAAIVAFLPGQWPNTPSPADASAAGEALGHLHLAGADFPMRRANNLGQERWRGLFAQSADRADEVMPGLGREIEAALEMLAARWPRNLPGGAIHADLFPDNLFMNDGKVSGVIDFYFACDDAYAYDLAIMLNAWCFQAGAWRDDLAAALIAGYETARPLSDVETAALPVLAVGAAMRFLLTRLHDWLRPVPGAVVTPKDPLEQLACLRLHRSRMT